MSEKVKKIVKKGRWIYGDTIQSEVWIIKQNYFEGPTPTDEDLTPGYPPRDGEGCFTTQAMYRNAGSRAFQRFAAHLTKQCG
jgi:hypothetical protein